MKYEDLPSISLCKKLLNVSFKTPQKNLAVYKYVQSIKPMQEFLENERQKLVFKYCIPTENPSCFDTTDEFFKKFEEVLKTDIESEVEKLGLSETDFLEEECCYPINKDLWLNANDIERVLRL